MPTKTTRFATRLLAGALAGLTLAGLCACATTTTPTDSGLSGRWQLDAGASDDVTAKVSGAIARAEAKRRERQNLGRHGGGAGSGGGGGDEGGGDEGAGADSGTAAAGGDFDVGGNLGANEVIGPDFRDLRERLQQTLASPSHLRLDVQPGLVDIQRDGLPAREYHPGESITRFDEYGAARLDSSWSGKAFVLRQRYTSGARVIERYELDAAGALLYSRSLEDPTVGKLQIKSLYRHAGS